MKKKLEGNIWKMFVFQLTQRRYYFPILAIYFLTLPDANAVQIGIWAGAGYLAEFLFELPSGYLADRIGHKKMLVLSKVFMVLAVSSFLYGGDLKFFILGAIFTSLSFASRSGTKAAFLHETLDKLDRGSEFVSLNTKISAYGALFSSFFIISIPFSTSIDIKTPLYICLAIDIIALLVAVSFVNPGGPERRSKKKSLFKIIKEVKGTEFLSLSLFTSVITAFAMASRNNYMFPYLDNLNFPIIFTGVVVGIAAIMQYFVGNCISKYENNVNIAKIFKFDLFAFPIVFILIAFIDNYYILAGIFILSSAYEMGRRSFIDGYLLKNHIHDKNYKATMLSIKGQITMIFNVIIVFSLGFVMNYSYKYGFYISGIVLFFILFLLYYIRVKNKIISK